MSWAISQDAQALETARVLPAGVSRIRLVGVTTDDITDKYDAQGQLEPLTGTLNQSLTVSDFARKSPQLAQLQSGLNAIEPGLGDQLAGANLYSDFHTQQQKYALAYERGLTNNLSMGMSAPIVHTSVQARFSSIGVNNGAAIAQQLGSLSPELTQGLYNFQTQSFNTAFFQQTIFSGKGYDAPHDFDKTQFGDTELAFKYSFVHSEHFYLTGQAIGHAPTGTAQSLTNIFDVGSGTGAWATAGQVAAEVVPVRWLSFGASEKATYFFTDTRERAVPTDENDHLPSLLAADGQVQSVTRAQPMQFESEVSSTVHISDDMVRGWTAFQYLSKGETTFSGPGNLDYAALSRDTALEATRLELGLGFSAVGLYRRKQFSLPIDISALYNTGLTGRNVPLSSYSRVDISVYL